MRKILLIALLAALAAAGGGLYYFNTVFLPVFLQQAISEKGRELINRSISYDEVTYRPGKGLLITNLKIAEKGQPDTAFLHIKEISSNIPLIPILKEKKIILPRVFVKGFSVTVSKIDDGLWNFSDILAPQDFPMKPQYRVLTGKIILKQGEISLTDLTGTLEPVTLSIAHLDAGFSLPRTIAFSVSGEIPSDQTKFSIQGVYDITSPSADFKIQAVNIDLVKKILPLTTIQNPFDRAFIKHADLKVTGDLSDLKLQGNLAAELSVTGQPLSGHGILEFQEALFVKKNTSMTLEVQSVLLDKTTVSLNDAPIFSGQIQGDNLFVIKNEDDNPADPDAPQTALTANAVRIRPEKVLAIGRAQITLQDIFLDSFSFQRPRLGEGFIIQASSLSSESAAISQKEFDVSGNLTLPYLWAALTPGTSIIRAPFSLDNASVRITDALIAQTDQITAGTLEIIHAQDHTDITGTASADPVSFLFPDGKSWHATPDAISLRLRRTSADPSALDYDITAALSAGSITSILPHVGDLTDINGTLAMTKDKLTLTDVGFTAQGTRASISGTIKPFSKWNADLSLSAENISIPQWIYLIKDVTAPYGLDITGTTDVTVLIKGPLVVPQDLKFSISAQVHKADIRSSRYPYAFPTIQGGLKYQDDILSWNNIRFEFQKEFYETSGSVRRFQEPVITMTLKGYDLNLVLNAESAGRFYKISRADLKTKRTSLSGSGNVSLDKANPQADVTVQGHVTWSDLQQFHPLIREKIKEWNLQGSGDIALRYTGNATDPKSARFSLAYQSELTTVKDIRFDSLSVKLNQPEPYENIFDIGSLFYDGRIAVSGNVRLDSRLPFKAQIDMSGVDLAKFKNALPLKDQNISGLLTGSVFLQGDAQNTSSFDGQGSAKIEQGYFVKPNLLKGIIALILAQEYQEVVFTDARARLFIRDNRLRMTNIFIKSSAVDLSGKGWVDINKNIDFIITPNFRIESSIKRDLLTSSTKAMIEKYLSIRATGSLMKPRYSTHVDSGAVMQDTADMIGDGVQTIFRGLGF